MVKVTKHKIVVEEKLPFEKIEPMYHRFIKRACYWEVVKYRGILQKIVPYDTHSELYQDVWINITRYYPNFDPSKSNIKSWIINITRTKAMRWIQQSRHQKRTGIIVNIDKVENQLPSTYMDENNLEIIFTDPRLKPLLRKCINKLEKKKHKFIIKKLYYKNNSVKYKITAASLAQQYLIPEKLIIKIRNDALRKLKVIIKQEITKTHNNGEQTIINPKLFLRSIKKCTS